MKTEKAFAKLNDGYRIGIVKIFKNSWSGEKKAQIVDVMWADGIRKEYDLKEFASLMYVMG